MFCAISQYLFPALSDAREPPQLLTDLVAAGHLGAKSGSGFYTYEGDQREDLARRRDRVLLKFLAALAEPPSEGEV